MLTKAVHRCNTSLAFV
jgi:F-type H+-transporting ATPase subunit gamma